MGFLKHLRAKRRPKPDAEATRQLVASLTPEERTVIHAAAIALGMARVKLTDRRLLILFVGFIAAVWWLFHTVAVHNKSQVNQLKTASNHFEAKQRINCQQTQFAFTLVNGYFDGQEAIIRNRTDLPAAVKASSIANIEKNKLKALDCS